MIETKKTGVPEKANPDTKPSVGKEKLPVDGRIRRLDCNRLHSYRRRTVDSGSLQP